MIQAWIPNSEFYFSLNGVSWYLSVCVLLYFVFPLVLKKMKHFVKTTCAIKMGAFALIIQIIFAIIVGAIASPSATDWFSQHWCTYIFPLYRLMDFVIGCSIGYLFVNSTKLHTINDSFIYIMESLAIILSIISCEIFTKGKEALGSESIKYTLLFLPASSLLILVIATQRGLLTKLLSLNFLVYLGNLSAYAFLIHLIAIEYGTIILNKSIPHTNPIVNCLIIFTLTILASLIWQKFCHKINLR